YGPIFIEFHPVKTDDPMVPVLIGDRPSVVDHDPLVLPRTLDYGMVAGAGSDVARFGFQDGPDTSIGSGGSRRHGIGDLVTPVGPVALGPHKIIDALAQEHKGPLDIALRGDLPEQAAVLPGDEAREIGIEP